MNTVWTIRARLLAGFIAISTITCGVAVVGYFGINSGKAAIFEIGSVRLPSVRGLRVISEAQNDIDSDENALLSPQVLSDKNRVSVMMTRFDTAKARFEEGWSVY